VRRGVEPASPFLVLGSSFYVLPQIVSDPGHAVSGEREFRGDS
jgi:hypothetical protein